jgi:transposase-like protein
MKEIGKRRRMTAEYKLRILKEVELCKGNGDVAALLRREGLYASYLTIWKQQRDSGALSALSQKRGRKAQAQGNPLLSELQELQKRHIALEEKYRQSLLIIDVQKKVSQILGVTLPNTRNLGMDS